MQGGPASDTIRSAMPPKSKLGQNFLEDQRAIARIAEAMGDTHDLATVEIGPGQGAITEALIHHSGHVTAIEVDPHLALRLRVRFNERQLVVLEQDVLQCDFTALSEQLGKRLAIAGNLPYYITSPILFHLAEHHKVIDHAVLMVQREVADRVTADPGSRDHGLLSVTTQLYGPTSRLFDLPPEAFNPPPQVHSTVFRWRFAPRFEKLGVPEGGIVALAKIAFAQKRKTLNNNLRAARFDAEVIHKAFEEAEIAPQARAEKLSIEDFAALWRSLEKMHGFPAPDSGK